VDAIVPAVNAVLARGPVNRSGSGWWDNSSGCYQTGFTVTKNDILAAAVVGISLPRPGRSGTATGSPRSGDDS